jgi:hypothetical protein
MRRPFLVSALILVAFALPASARAEGRAHVGGFGGFTFGGTTTAPTFGGSIGAPLAPHIQIVAEAGRLDDVMPATIGSLIDLTPFDARVSAWYGEAGVRFVASPRSAVTPYAEATAGFARMQSGFAGAGRAGPFVDAALRFFDRTEPLLGAGGGVVLRGGPIALDLGYRYKKILASDSLQALMTGGNGITVSQARIGLGVSF